MSVVLLTSSSRVVTPDHSECQSAKNTRVLRYGMQPYNVDYIYIYHLKDKVPQVNVSFKQIINASLKIDLQTHAKRSFIQT
jgi:hypothetical protein